MRLLHRVDVGQENRSPDNLEGNTIMLDNSTLEDVSLNVIRWRGRQGQKAVKVLGETYTSQKKSKQCCQKECPDCVYL